MYQFKKIIIALDLTKMDNTILKYASGMCKIINPSKIYFLNIQENLDLDDEVKELLMGKDMQPMDEYVQQKMKKSVTDNFEHIEDYKIEYEVVEGKPSKELLRWVKMKETDLLIMGRKRELKGTGIVPQEVSSKALSSILIVPEDYTTFSLKHILVPIDFSEHCIKGMEKAIEMNEKHNDTIKISGTHIFELPLGYEKSGKSEEEFTEIMKVNASKKFNKLQAEKFNNHPIAISYSKADEDESISETINAEAHKIEADLIIMGAKGRTAATQIFLGSVTSKLIKYDTDIPLLVIKNKNDTFDFWDMFKSL